MFRRWSATNRTALLLLFYPSRGHRFCRIMSEEEKLQVAESLRKVTQSITDLTKELALERQVYAQMRVLLIQRLPATFSCS